MLPMLVPTGSQCAAFHIQSHLCMSFASILYHICLCLSLFFARFLYNSSLFVACFDIFIASASVDDIAHFCFNALMHTVYREGKVRGGNVQNGDVFDMHKSKLMAMQEATRCDTTRQVVARCNTTMDLTSTYASCLACLIAVTRFAFKF